MMEQFPRLENKKTRTRGQIELIWIDAEGNRKVWKSENFVVDEAVESIKDLLLGLWSGTIYRMALGSGGYVGTSRNHPDDTWHSKTGLASPVYSKEFDSTPVAVQMDHTWSIQATCTFNSSDLTPSAWPLLTNVSEAGLIVGSGTSGDQEGNSNYMGLGDRLYAYRTFEEKSFLEGAGTSLQVVWTIFVEKV